MTKYSIFKCHAFKPLDYRYVSIHMHLLSLIFHKSQQKKYLPRNDPLMNYFILLLVVANNSILYLSVSSEGQKKNIIPLTKPFFQFMISLLKF